MIINEIFYSLQGEGKLTGTPCIFVRLAGCPLRCKWCDTKYAWPPSAGSEYSPQQVKEKIRDYPTRHIVITGGEPMTNPVLSEFLASFTENDMHITIETSGIKFLPDLPCNLMSISPKTSNSTPAEPPAAAEHEKNRLNLPALQQLIDNYNYQLKFVVDKPGDLDEIAECLKSLQKVNPYKVHLMPQVTTRNDYLLKSQMVADLCKQTGFTFSQRLHVLLWNNKNGT